MTENTTKRDPKIHLLGAMSEGIDGYITGMEADGQRQLVASSELPAEGPWPELEALGFVRGEPVKGDALFVNATLPEGWSKQATDHSMHSTVVDERGVERVSVFYKAAFYDRRASCHLVHVGANFASHAVWSDGEPQLPDCWVLLTDVEKGAYRAELERALHDEQEKRPYFGGREEALRISDERIARIRACMALLESKNPEAGE